ncbi:Kre28p NDAI_0F04590 [Naumovozyma dairenensis CBS 421]|uniref:Spindle pole body component KRE28 n=1 Tax=Naumovozyma dairenensis (strain ATCC 10597 / BCRC 20456 / CBS 421 / NBRC 0211 / NRRL Y-12639) TaxID=1071378 RepID=G0WDB6_NAUDC|nr:hypothetical protein NDAI_0F04590 [Naumovozyma dairenensis CBS 421]CCD25777.1 hypothetical protein NDAI_0F04590 [Naumovozyma dairenensis CBS 421]
MISNDDDDYMDYITSTKYEGQLDDLLMEITQMSEQFLHEQERKVDSTLNEITQSVETMKQDNNTLIETQSSGAGTGTDTAMMMIDIKDFPSNIEKFNKLLELLKMVHLDQDSLDYFLRYTVLSNDGSKNKPLSLKSIDDPQFVSLEREVDNLQNNEIAQQLNEINGTKLKIFKINDTIFQSNNELNELSLNLGNEIDECWDLLNEFNDLKDKKLNSTTKNGVKTSRENDPVNDTYNEFKKLNDQNVKLTKLNDEMNLVQKSVARFKNKTHKYDDKDKDTNGNDEIDKEKQTLEVLNGLIKLFENTFMKISSNLNNLKISPGKRQIEFEINNKYKIILILSQYGNDERLSDIKITRIDDSNDDDDLNCKRLEKDFNLKFHLDGSGDYGNRKKKYSIFEIMESIIERIEKL